MINSISPTGITLLLAVSNLSAATHYVSPESTNPTPPYTTWATAAINVQDAVDAAVSGERIVVTNGTYPGDIVVTNALALMSANGPQGTTVDAGGWGRCVSLNDGASLTGFTVTHGAGSWVEGCGVRCSSTNVFLTNCVIADNGAAYDFGGGVYSGTLYNCVLTNNCANRGGGVYDSTLYNCTLCGNVAIRAWIPGQRLPGYGGGAFGCTLYNCTLTDNSADFGGGADSSTLYNCTLTADSAGLGGGVRWCTLYNCTVTGNSGWQGGGANDCNLYNCIVYFNASADGANYDSSSTLNHCCTTPLPANGVGNIALDPQLASASHLSADSPCRGAGNAAYATGTDIDGEPWANPPSIGCDEYHSGGVTGPLTVNLTANYTNVVRGYPISLAARIEGRTTDSVWEFGDGALAINQPFTTHSWTAPGDYTVALWAFNESHLEGVSASTTIHVASQPIVYVAAKGTNPQPPYLSWATAATNIQDAVDAPLLGFSVVVVDNGKYPGDLSVNRPVKLLSANGPQFTVIDGGGTNTCVWLETDGAEVSGFTLTNCPVFEGGVGVCCNSTNSFVTNCVLAGNTSGGAVGGVLYNCVLSANSGGGAYQSTLYNCRLIGNWTTQWGGGAGGGWGGGARECRLYNCVLSGNSGYYGGGGAAYCDLYNCTLTGNWTGGSGGGAAYSTLYNCIIDSNTGLSGGANYDTNSSLNHCCTIPFPTSGIGNISASPQFLDYAHGNLRLQSTSPCINAGNNSYLTDSDFTNCFDLDGNRRIVSGTVDIGAYEYQGTGSRISYAWLQQYGLPTDGSADFIDSDRDGLNNWQEWVCGTCPTNALSVLRMVAALPTGTNATVTWESVAGVSYFLEHSTNLSAPFSVLATNILGQAGTTSYADTNAGGPGPRFYRVGVAPP